MEPSSKLSIEQKLLIQANREKALAIRKAKESSKFLKLERNTASNVCSMNNTLTKDEKQKRIEANRKKALALLRDKQKAKISSSSHDQLKQNHVRTHEGENCNIENKNTNLIQRQKASTSEQCTENKLPKFDNNSSVSVTSKKLLKTISGVCTLQSNERFTVECTYHQELLEVFKSIPSRSFDIKSKTWSFDIQDHDLLLELIKPLHPEVVIGGIPTFVLKTLNKETNLVDCSTLDSLHEKIRNSLLPFQSDGVRFGISQEGRILIADDMGLGKTIQAIGIADYYRKEWPVLCVVPSSVRFTWSQAFKNWLPYIKHDDVVVLNSGRDKISKAKIVITSYDLLSRCRKEMLKQNFQVIIMDESHFLKNFKSNRTQAAREIAKNGKRLILLSGTPALSRPLELYPQLNMLNPKLFSSLIQFGIRYCNGKKVPWGNGWDFNGSSYMVELQILLRKGIMIRRLKADILLQLPSKQRSVVLLDPCMISGDSKIMKIAEQSMHKTKSSYEKHGALLHYFRESASAKLGAICNYIEDLLESDRKFLCFAHHQVMLDSICDLLRRKKVKFIRIDGRTSSEKRKELCDDFQSNKGQVAVLSITAANAGLTLTAASLVVFAELFWNPGILTQAEDRVHRIGQKDMVNIQYLVAKGTADDFLWPLVQKKLDVLNKAGLSKDNFSDADTKISHDSKQSSILKFLHGFDEDLLEGDCSIGYENENKRMKLS